MKKGKKNFFISYTSPDVEYAKWIAGVLEAEGYSTIIQAWDFRAGGNFVMNMHRALIDAKKFIAVLSSNYMKSLYTQAEWTAAFTNDPGNHKSLFIPVRIEDIEPEGLLKPIIYIDLFNRDEVASKKALLSGVDENDIPRTPPLFPGNQS